MKTLFITEMRVSYYKQHENWTRKSLKVWQKYNILYLAVNWIITGQCSNSQRRVPYS